MQMTPKDWDRAKELFEAALELDPAQRASFLTENCRDASLQHQVEKLLTDYQAAGSFLDSPALHFRISESIGLAELQMEELFRPDKPSGEHRAGRESAPEDRMVNRHLGAYKLVRQI